MRQVASSTVRTEGTGLTSIHHRYASANNGHAARHTRRNASFSAQASAGDLDPIERAVGWLFGKKAIENRKPFGMSRLVRATPAPRLVKLGYRCSPVSLWRG